MTKKLRTFPEDFTYQLSLSFNPKKARRKLCAMQSQLEKYGDKEGVDFIYRDDGKGDTALFTLGERRRDYCHYEQAPVNMRGTI